MFLRDYRTSDRKRRFMIKHGNDRSLCARRRAFDRIGWEDGRDHWSPTADRTLGLG